MKKIILLIFFYSPLYFYGQTTKDVFVIIGQSNASGYGTYGDSLVEESIDNQILLNWWYDSWGAISQSNQWVNLEAQYGPSIKTEGIFGPEIEIGRELKDKGYNPAIIKFTAPGRSLATYFKLPGDGGKYDLFKDFFKNAVNDLLYAGYNVKIRGVIWLQGEKDAKDLNNASAYYSNLNSIINDFKEFVSEPNLFVALGVNEESTGQYLSSVVDAQKQIANETYNSVFVSELGLKKSLDNTHLSCQGVLNHGKRISTEMLNWEKTESHNQNIGGWIIGDNHSYYPGDYDGDGQDEILCVKNGASGWVTLLDYVNGNWIWKWSNYGSTSAGSSIYYYKDDMSVGDFDGDGKDELIGYSGTYMKVLGFNSGNFTSEWLRSSSQTAMWDYRGDLIAGDYDGDGKDEILGNDLDGTGGWITMFHFNNSSIDWTWGWSNNGSTSAGASIYYYRNDLKVGDFDGDGKDELIGYSSSHMKVLGFNSGNFTSEWLRSSSQTGMWPYRNKLVIGDFDTDNKDEILGIYTWATKYDFNNSSSDFTWSHSANDKLSDWDVDIADVAFFIRKNQTDYSELAVVELNNEKDNIFSFYRKNQFESDNHISYSDFPYTFNLLKSYSAEFPITNIFEEISDIENKFKIYPSVVSNQLNIQIPNNSNLKNITLKIINVDGKLIRQEYLINTLTNLYVDLSHGIYFVKIFTLNQLLYSQQIIVEE